MGEERNHQELSSGSTVGTERGEGNFLQVALWGQRGERREREKPSGTFFR
jgi:hypothetical protein